jgi:hypothetical protein
MPTQEVPDGGNVKEWLTIWSAVELVQDPLSSSGTAAAT